MRIFRVALLAVASLFLSACGYNTLQVQDETVKSAWSEVVNQYQRRADLIPNLVATVKGFAAQEAGRAGRRDRGARPGHDQVHGRTRTIPSRSSSSRRRRASCRARCRA